MKGTSLLLEYVKMYVNLFVLSVVLPFINSFSESFFDVLPNHTMLNLAVIKETREHSLHHCLHQCLANAKCSVGTFDTKSRLCSQSSCMRWDSPIFPSSKTTFFGKQDYRTCCDRIEGEFFKGSPMYDCRLTAPVGNDCQEILAKGYAMSGLYHLRPIDHRESFDALCDMVTENGGWTLLQRRRDGGLNFSQNWHDYTFGFGDLLNDFWLGNKFIRLLTKGKPRELRLEVTEESGRVLHHRFKDFFVKNPESDYAISFDTYSSHEAGGLSNSFADSLNQKFSTYDRDNDNANSNCAADFQGGWWYTGDGNVCHKLNLNSMAVESTVGSGITWEDHTGTYKVYKYSEMKIRTVVT